MALDKNGRLALHGKIQGICDEAGLVSVFVQLHCQGSVRLFVDKNRGGQRDRDDSPFLVAMAFFHDGLTGVLVRDNGDAVHGTQVQIPEFVAR